MTAHKYPTEITQRDLERLAAVSNDTIHVDIADTRQEIAQMKKQAEAYLLLSDPGLVESRINYFRYTATLGGIEQREAFIMFLEAVLKAREAEIK